MRPKKGWEYHCADCSGSTGTLFLKAHFRVLTLHPKIGLKSQDWSIIIGILLKEKSCVEQKGCQEQEEGSLLVENLIRKIDALESRIVALEASSTYFRHQSSSTTSRQKVASNTEINALPQAKARSSLNGNKEESLFLSTTTSEPETTTAEQPTSSADDNASWWEMMLLENYSICIIACTFNLGLIYIVLQITIKLVTLAMPSVST